MSLYGPPEKLQSRRSPNAPTRQLDIRKIDGMLTPKEQFFTPSISPKPEIDPAGYRLKVHGQKLVEQTHRKSRWQTFAP